MGIKRWRYTIPLRLRSLLRRTRQDQELHDELWEHIDEKTESYVEQGIERTEARRMALLEMGGVEQAKEQCRAARRVNWIQDLVQDLRYAGRLLRRSPGFAMLAALTLAVGIGANTAIFSIVDAVLLRPLPYPDPGQLVLIFNTPLQKPEALASVSYRDFTLLREQNRVFVEIAGNAFHDLTLTNAGDPFVVNTATVTPEIFSLFDAKALAGRLFLPEEGKVGASPVAMVSESLWRSRFGSDPAFIGRTITLDMRPFTVVGVLPASFRYPDGGPHQDVWIPIAQDPLFGPLLLRPGTRVMAGVGRLKPGVSLSQAQAEMSALGARLAQDFPAEDSGFTVHLRSYPEAVTGRVKSPLLILLGAVALVLLISCANIANLLLSRATSRTREIAVRIALGARRSRIIRQLLAESALLGLIGGTVGVLLAVVVVRALQPWIPPDVTRINSIHVRGAVLLFAFVLSLVSALGFGLAPALFATSREPQTNLLEGDQRTGRRSGRFLQSALAVTEISLAAVLLVAGGLLMRSFALVTSVNPGFDANNILKAEVSLPRFQYATPQQWSALSSKLVDGLHSQPGLQDSAVAAPLPMDHQGQATLTFSIVGNPPLSSAQLPTANYTTMTPDYFHVMRIPLLRGRLFSDLDSSSNPKVAIISETLAQRYFPNQDPIGQKMRFGFPPNSDVPREIVGIVGDVRDVALSRTPGPIMYVPFAQEPLWGGEVVIRSSLDMASVAAAVRQTVYAIDKNLPVTDVEPLTDPLGQSISQERFRTFLLGSFSAIALLLATVGVFGVVSYLASQRTHEIGIRMALGAQPGQVLRLVLGQAARLTVTGLTIGLTGAFLLTRLMKGLLYGVSASDPLTFISTAMVLAVVALAACYVPARRAAKIEPIEALRYE